MRLLMYSEAKAARFGLDSRIAVFGLGGIGLNVIQAARMVGADKIIGIDINPAKCALAEKSSAPTPAPTGTGRRSRADGPICAR